MAKRSRRRRICSDDGKRMICRQARLPGLSESQVARRYDVNANLVFTWLRDPRFAPEEVDPPIEALVADTAASAGDAAATFLPVELIEGAEATPSPDAPMASSTAGTMEIVLAGGHRLCVEGAYDPDALARLLRGLTGSAPSSPCRWARGSGLRRA